mmetsp:Transcript_13788/g.21018  ORF Transcript_13788/g.21018 Transcript_13788/m.21018 type:complete len:81 (+) Transcript_13788:541-783(+)
MFNTTLSLLSGSQRRNDTLSAAKSANLNVALFGKLSTHEKEGRRPSKSALETYYNDLQLLNPYNVDSRCSSISGSDRKWQ